MEAPADRSAETETTPRRTYVVTSCPNAAALAGQRRHGIPPVIDGRIVRHGGGGRRDGREAQALELAGGRQRPGTNNRRAASYSARRRRWRWRGAPLAGTCAVSPSGRLCRQHQEGDQASEEGEAGGGKGSHCQRIEESGELADVVR